MKVYHPDAGVFVPYDVYNGIYESESGNSRPIDQELASHCDEGLLEKWPEKRFRVDQEMPTFKCKECGNLKFYVGTHNWSTYIKCANCGIEECVHNG